MIDLYYSPTPHGWKIAIMLEECGLDYHTILVRLHKGDQFTPEFLAISPAGQIPAIVDRDPGGEPVPVFESAAILLYLADKTNRFAPSAASMTSSAKRRELLQWLFWHSSSQGPTAGQLSHFVHDAPGEQEYGQRLYTTAYKRNLAMLENRLRERDYILDEYSIADMACFPSVFIAKRLGVDLTEYPAVQAWRGMIKSRPAVQRAIDLHKDKQVSGKYTREHYQAHYDQIESRLRRAPTWTLQDRI